MSILQGDFFEDWEPPPGDRGGETYEHQLDFDRLNSQMGRCWRAMKDGEWHTLSQLSHLTGDPEASISARLRDFRKNKFGALVMESRRVPGEEGLWEYRLIVEVDIEFNDPI